MGITLKLFLVSAVFGVPSAFARAPLEQIGFEQNLAAQVPLDAEFRDEGGKPVSLAGAMRGRPTVLALVYYRCPVLCTETLNGVLRAARAISFDAGREFEIAALSFDPREGPSLAADKKKAYVQRYGRPDGARGWTFLTGSEASIRRVTEAVGFRAAFDPEREEYAHAAGLVVLTPDGRVSRYLFGSEYAAGDLRSALVEASAGRIGTPVDRLLLYCYRYDPMTGRYGLAVGRALKAAAIATLLLLAAAVTRLGARQRA